MLLSRLLDRYEEEKALGAIRERLSGPMPTPHKAEFLGHFLRSEFQPILENRGNCYETIGFEAFVRPATDDRSVSPLTFFENLKPDDVDFVDNLSRQLHVTNFLKLAMSRDEISLNVSAIALETHAGQFDFLRKQMESAERAGLDTNRINLELPFSPSLDAAVVFTFASQLRSYGLKITLEDFDADQASFSRIIFVRPDYVKFNRSWLDKDLTSSEYRMMVRNIVQSLNALGVRSHMERIETEEEARFAILCGFSRLQGYLFQKPQEDLHYPHFEIV